jgi:isoquinoline 1-oxidoreductase subunit beta
VGEAPTATTSTRTAVISQALGMGGLLIAAGSVGVRRLEAAEAAFAPGAEPWEPHAYVRLGDDGIVTIMCHRSEMGQGIRTTMPMIIADEMEADWSRCRVEQALGDEPKYGSQNTDGSTSIRDFLPRTARPAPRRALLEDAAAKEWGVPTSEVRARNGEIVHTATGRTQAFGSLVATARSIPMPDRNACASRRPPSGAGKARRCRPSTSCR